MSEIMTLKIQAEIPEMRYIILSLFFVILLSITMSGELTDSLQRSIQLVTSSSKKIGSGVFRVWLVKGWDLWLYYIDFYGPSRTAGRVKSKHIFMHPPYKVLVFGSFPHVKMSARLSYRKEKKNCHMALAYSMSLYPSIWPSAMLVSSSIRSRKSSLAQPDLLTDPIPRVYWMSEGGLGFPFFNGDHRHAMPCTFCRCW